jgi:two-component system phosphate regulon response regulator PhoB
MNEARATQRSSTNTAPRVLVVEDEAALSLLLSYNLEAEGFIVERVERGDEAELKLEEAPPDLLILDWMLPGVSGLEICRRLRARKATRTLPVIMLTARGEEAERVSGLKLGADDYVVKPFSAGELVARMRAIMRRGRGTARKGPVTVGPLTLDPAARTVTKRDEPVELAAKEFDLLHLLMTNAGQVCTREQIMDEVWDPHWFGPTKTLDVHVSWLRKKIEDDPSNPRFITTVRGVGFRFASPDEAA